MSVKKFLPMVITNVEIFKVKDNLWFFLVTSKYYNVLHAHLYTYLSNSDFEHPKRPIGDIYQRIHQLYIEQ